MFEVNDIPPIYSLELQQSDEAAREKFAKVIADWLCKEGDRLA